MYPGSDQLLIIGQVGQDFLQLGSASTKRLIVHTIMLSVVVFPDLAQFR